MRSVVPSMAGSFLAAVSLLVPAASHAQPLGSFTWQLQPYCNRVTVNVRQDGAVYTLDGYDDQCGGAQRAALVGLATPNPDGTIGFGLNIIAPSGQAVPVQARIAIATLAGTWSDSAGNSGTFAFGANTGGNRRPVAAAPGDITGVSTGTGLTGGGTAGDVTLAVNPTVVQSRVTTTCPAGQALRSIAQDGTAVCELVTGAAGGDVTSVTAGPGLTGGGLAGDLTLNVAFQGSGSRNFAARSDHTHLVGPGAVGIGPGALEANTGNGSTAVGDGALGSNTTGSFNVAVGHSASTGAASNLSTVLGTAASASTGLSNATAIGALARVTQSDSLVLGSIAGVNGATADTDVGIGTSAPSARLDIANGFNTTDVRITKVNGVPGIVMRRPQGTLAAPLATPGGFTVGQWAGQGYDAATFATGAQVVLRTTQDWSPSGRGTQIRFEVTANGTTAPVTRMTVDHDGNVGVGTSLPDDRLDVNGDIRVGISGTNGCLKNNGGGVIAGTCSSDARFKRDITPFAPSLDRVAALRPVHYFWRAEAFPQKGFGPSRAYGLVAQDVEQVLPEIVTTDADGYRQVDYGKLPLLAVRAIGELKTQLDDLATQNDQLGALVAALRDRNAALELRVAALEQLSTMRPR